MIFGSRHARSRPSLVVLSIALVAALIFPWNAGAQGAGNSFAAYVAYPQSVDTTIAYSPLFRVGASGMDSTIAIHNETNDTVRVDFRASSFEGVVISLSADISPRATDIFGGTELSLPTGFSGSLAATASGEISAVISHGGATLDRMSLPGYVAPAANLFVPLAFNNYNGWNSLVSVMNTNLTTDVIARVVFHVEGRPAEEQAVFAPAGGAQLLDLQTLPAGPMSIEILAPAGSTLVAAAYHIHPQGTTSENLAASTGTARAFTPLLFRKAGFENGYDSGVQVVNASDVPILPTATFVDRDTGERIGPLPAARPLVRGQSYTWYLPAIAGLRDGRIYSAEVDAAGGSILVVTNHVNYVRITGSVYAGLGSGVAALSAPILLRNVDRYNSGIQIQNLGTADQVATVRFRTLTGASVDSATQTVLVPANSSTTIYLPTATGLFDGFSGSAEITSAGGQVAAVVNTVRYR